MVTDEQFSRLYGFLADRTSDPNGDEWEHGPLQRLVRELAAVIEEIQALVCDGVLGEEGS